MAQPNMWFVAIASLIALFFYGEIQYVRSDDNFNRQERLLLNDPQAMMAQLLTLQRKVDELNAKMENEKSQHGGEVFVRWGRKDCPTLNGTQMVYSGIAAGPPYHETGNAANTLCLPHDPNNTNSGFPHALQDSGFVGHIYGAEYQYYYRNVKLDDDVPCAVCIDNQATTSIMIPGKTSCPIKWRKQYHGHVCSEAHHHYSPSEYTCVDDDSQYFEGTRQHNDDGKLFYPVVTICGSLPCPPYENNKYLPCVVCTK